MAGCVTLDKREGGARLEGTLAAHLQRWPRLKIHPNGAIANIFSRSSFN